ncbi:histone-lysine N-methyltransferase SETMAR [Trichonephila clavipes]|nr:histone-lysine N-methyltransferase SETMAR [Trichonephila clavipes]
MHPPYSPDLPPNVYHRFLAFQNFLSGKKLGSREDCENRFLGFFANKGQDFYERGNMKLPLQWQQIIQQNEVGTIDKYSACVEVGTHRRKFRLCRAKVEEKQFETLNKETATHIGIREAEDWFRPIDLAKECDIYISSRSGSHKEIPITYGYTQDPFKIRSQNFKTKIKENYPQYLERENKNCFICGDSSHCARDCEKRFKPKESNDHIHNRIKT